MKRIAILCAMAQEIQPFYDAIDIEDESRIGSVLCWKSEENGKKLLLVQSGVGKVHAAAAAQLVIREYAPDALFSCGTAGALDTRCQIGDIVVGTTTIQHDYGFVLPDTFVHFGQYILKQNRKRKFFREFPANSALLKSARRMKHPWGTAVKIFPGPIVTGDQIIFSTKKRRELFERFEALAVEMESAAIAQVCKMNGIPFLAVRGISDYADESIHLDTSKIDLNDFAEWTSASFGEKVSLLTTTISYLAQHPSTFTLSRQARKNMKLAATHSAEFTLRLLHTL